MSIKSSNRLQQNSKPLWQWSKVSTVLKTRLEGKSAKIPLQSTVSIVDPLINPTQQIAHGRTMQQKVHIDIEKSLQYESQVGWNWHKSSNLPNITIKVQIQDLQKEQYLVCPPKVEAKVYAVKIVLDNFDHQQKTYLEDVGIRGYSKIEMKDGCGVFSGIRFLSTSYNNQGVKFYLLIVLSIPQDKSTDKNQHHYKNIIASIISPPIFVDSRKSAQDYQGKKFSSFVELFPPQEITKRFTLKKIRGRDQSQIKINNNFDGLYSYLTAPNIRHKVKHPLFLSMRFSRVFKIYYNSEQQYPPLSTNNKVNQVITKLQKKLVKDVGTERRTRKCQNLSKKLFLIRILTMVNSAQKAKIMDLLDFLNCKSIHIVEDQAPLHPSFLDLSQLGDVDKAYREEYDELIRMSDRQISSRNRRKKNQTDANNINQEDFQHSENDQLQNSENCSLNSNPRQKRQELISDKQDFNQNFGSENQQVKRQNIMDDEFSQQMLIKRENRSKNVNPLGGRKKITQMKSYQDQIQNQVSNESRDQIKSIISMNKRGFVLNTQPITRSALKMRRQFNGNSSHDIEFPTTKRRVNNNGIGRQVQKQQKPVQNLVQHLQLSEIFTLNPGAQRYNTIQEQVQGQQKQIQQLKNIIGSQVIKQTANAAINQVTISQAVALNQVINMNNNLIHQAAVNRAVNQAMVTFAGHDVEQGAHQMGDPLLGMQANSAHNGNLMGISMGAHLGQINPMGPINHMNSINAMHTMNSLMNSSLNHPLNINASTLNMAQLNSSSFNPNPNNGQIPYSNLSNINQNNAQQQIQQQKIQAIDSLSSRNLNNRQSEPSFFPAPNVLNSSQPQLLGNQNLLCMPLLHTNSLPVPLQSSLPQSLPIISSHGSTIPMPTIHNGIHVSLLSEQPNMNKVNGNGNGIIGVDGNSNPLNPANANINSLNNMLLINQIDKIQQRQMLLSQGNRQNLNQLLGSDRNNNAEIKIKMIKDEIQKMQIQNDVFRQKIIKNEELIQRFLKDLQRCGENMSNINNNNQEVGFRPRGNSFSRAEAIQNSTRIIPNSEPINVQQIQSDFYRSQTHLDIKQPQEQHNNIDHDIPFIKNFLDSDMIDMMMDQDQDKQLIQNKYQNDSV